MRRLGPMFTIVFFTAMTGTLMVRALQMPLRNVTFHAKTKVLPGYASVKIVAEFKPGKASVRMPANAQFIVRGRSPMIRWTPGKRELAHYEPGKRVSATICTIAMRSDGGDHGRD